MAIQLDGIGINDLTNSMYQINSGINSIVLSSDNLNKGIIQNTKIKENLLNVSKDLHKRKIYNIKMREQEDAIETSKTNISSSSAIDFSERTSDSIFGRVFNIAAFIGVGWLTENYEQWMKLGESFNKNVSTISSTVSSSLKDTLDYTELFGSFLTNFNSKVTSVKIIDTQKNLYGVFGDLFSSMTTIQDSLSNFFRSAIDSTIDFVNAVRSSLGLGGPGEDGGGGGIAGGYYGGYSPKSGLEKEIYDYLVNNKQMNDNQALGLLANISRESGFSLTEIGDHGRSKGLFQWKDERAVAMMKAIPDWKTNWKAQIDYALTEPRDLSLVEPGEYLSIKFNSPQEAADWWAREWERPADLVDAREKHRKYISSVPKSPEGKIQFRSGTELTGVEGGGFSTGLLTGPEERIGSGTDYHIDARFISSLPLSEKIKLLDSMALSYASQGRVMEFSGASVAGKRWNINASYKEKERFARAILTSHWEPRPGWDPFDYYTVLAGSENRKDKSAEGAQIMAPYIEGGSVIYRLDPNGSGRYIELYDKNNKLIFKTLHGDINKNPGFPLNTRIPLSKLSPRSSNDGDKTSSVPTKTNQPESTNIALADSPKRNAENLINSGNPDNIVMIDNSSIAYNPPPTPASNTVVFQAEPPKNNYLTQIVYRSLAYT